MANPNGTFSLVLCLFCCIGWWVFIIFGFIFVICSAVLSLNFLEGVNIIVISDGLMSLIQLLVFMLTFSEAWSCLGKRRIYCDFCYLSKHYILIFHLYVLFTIYIEKVNEQKRLQILSSIKWVFKLIFLQLISL